MRGRQTCTRGRRMLVRLCGCIRLQLFGGGWREWKKNGGSRPGFLGGWLLFIKEYEGSSTAFLGPREDGISPRLCALVGWEGRWEQCAKRRWAAEEFTVCFSPWARFSPFRVARPLKSAVVVLVRSPVSRSCCGAHAKVIDDVLPMTQSWHPLLSRDEIPQRILYTY